MMEIGIPRLSVGHAGTGKTFPANPACALLNRPVIRSQHTASTEESHITGQILAREGTTYFGTGGFCRWRMKNGWVYLADEYDFAFPQILGSTSQVLEGEPLDQSKDTRLASRGAA
ncbi:AAA family ATPase [Klebsiella pneumoniae]|nr:AAA family ATPase [Klebsiella pneumoniae]